MFTFFMVQYWRFKLFFVPHSVLRKHQLQFFCLRRKTFTFVYYCFLLADIYFFCTGQWAEAKKVKSELLSDKGWLFRSLSKQAITSWGCLNWLTFGSDMLRQENPAHAVLISFKPHRLLYQVWQLIIAAGSCQQEFLVNKTFNFISLILIFF